MSVRRLAVNPADPTMRYTITDKGYIQEYGGAIPIPMERVPAIDDKNALNGSEGDRPAPTWFHKGALSRYVAGFQITDWSGPGGYVLDVFGKLYPFGTAADPAAQLPGTGKGSTTQWTYPHPRYVDLVMDPSGNGQGYALVDAGWLNWFTGTPSVTRVTAQDLPVRRVQMDYTTKKYHVLGARGRVWAGNGAGVIQAVNFGSRNYPPFSTGLSAAGFHLLGQDTNDPGWLVNQKGRVYQLGLGAEVVSSSPRRGGGATVRDFVVIDDGTGGDPWRAVTLWSDGAQIEWVSSTPPFVFAGGPGRDTPEDPTTETTRPTIVWDYFDVDGDDQLSWEVAVLESSEWDGSFTNEVQEIDTTGGPTGGTFRLGFQGQTTGDIAYNAAAATIEAALEALSNIGTGNVACTGGPLPTAVQVTFEGALEKHDWPLLTLDDNSLSGGSSPSVTIVETTPGTGVDPAEATAVFRASGESKTDRSVEPTVNLPNGILRAYVRVTDTSALQSDWNFVQWEQDATPPAAVTLTATADNLAGEVDLAVADADPSTLVAIQYRDDDGDQWDWVRDATALVPDGSGDATAVDREAIIGVERTYRAFPYTLDPWIVGEESTDTATVVNSSVWWLTAPRDPALGTHQIQLRGVFNTSRERVMGVFQGAGDSLPVVVTDGSLKGMKSTLEAWALTRAQRLELEKFINSDEVLHLRDPYGRSWYLVVQSEEMRLIRAAKLAAETTAIRDANEVDIPVVQVARPSAAPTDERLVAATE